MIREDTAKRLGADIMKSTQAASQADGTSPLKITSVTKLIFTRGPHTFAFEGLVVKDLDVEVLAGTPFLEQNDIYVRPARQKITFADGTLCTYGPHKAQCAHVLHALGHPVTLFPGDYIKALATHQSLLNRKKTTTIQNGLKLKYPRALKVSSESQT